MGCQRREREQASKVVFFLLRQQERVSLSTTNATQDTSAALTGTEKLGRVGRFLAEPSKP